MKGKLSTELFQAGRGPCLPLERTEGENGRSLYLEKKNLLSSVPVFFLLGFAYCNFNMNAPGKLHNLIDLKNSGCLDLCYVIIFNLLVALHIDQSIDQLI